MFRLLIPAAAALMIAGSALAQQAAPPAAPPPAAGERLQLSPEQRDRIRAARDACVAEVKPRTLPRGERRKAMRACMEAKSPDLAPIFSRGEARRAEIRQARDACRAEMRGKRLGREERQQAMRTCLVGKRPELAKVLSCRDEAMKKNLGPGAERRAFMQSCVRG
jgi:hypothetical protein